MNNLDYMLDGLPLYRINNIKTIFLNSYNAIKNNNEYIFNIPNINIYKPSKLSLNTFVFNNSSNYNNFNEIKIKGININPESYINSDFNGHPTIGNIVFDNNNIPSTYISPSLISGITPISINNNVIYNLLNTPSNSYNLILPFDTIGDILLVGSGGYGGLNSYSGGGGCGELLYINNYLFSSGTYTININNHLSYTPTDVRQYPPKTYTSINTISGSGPFTITITLDNTGITYGSGNYVITTSSYAGSGNGLELIFNRSITTASGYATNSNRYDNITGYYTLTDNYLVNGYYGEYITIKLPVSISLCYYNIITASTTTKLPTLFNVYGSNDGINWTEITQASNNTNELTLVSYPLYFGAGYASGGTSLPIFKKILSTPSLSYQYFGFVFNKILGPDTRIFIQEIELFGFEDAYSNSISKLNILSHYRDLIPKTYTSTSYIGTTSNNGSTNYKYSITLNSDGIESNEAGVWEIVSTGNSSYASNFPYNILARVSGSFTCNTTSSYSAGVYIGTRYLESSSYTGEWFFIKLPSVRLLWGFSIMNTTALGNLPGEWKFYGSNTGADGSWTEIPDGSQSTRLATGNYIQNGSYYYYNKYFTNPTSYLYYGICANKLTTSGTTTITWGAELFLFTKDILTIQDKPSNSDGSVSIIKDNIILLKANAGGDGGYIDNLNLNVLPTSGGSGGGSYMNNSPSNSGIPFNNIYTSGIVSNGNTGILNSIGGSGGSINYVSSISGSSINYGVGGTGATLSSTPITKVNGKGDGGDGNGGIPSGGSVSIIFKNVIDYNVFKYMNNSGIEIEPQNINQLIIYNPNVSSTSLNFNMVLDIEEL